MYHTDESSSDDEDVNDCVMMNVGQTSIYRRHMVLSGMSGLLSNLASMASTTHTTHTTHATHATHTTHATHATRVLVPTSLPANTTCHAVQLLVAILDDPHDVVLTNLVYQVCQTCVQSAQSAQLTSQLLHAMAYFDMPHMIVKAAQCAANHPMCLVFDDKMDKLYHQMVARHPKTNLTHWHKPVQNLTYLFGCIDALAVPGIFYHFCNVFLGSFDAISCQSCNPAQLVLNSHTKPIGSVDLPYFAVCKLGQHLVGFMQTVAGNGIGMSCCHLVDSFDTFGTFGTFDQLDRFDQLDQLDRFDQLDRLDQLDHIGNVTFSASTWTTTQGIMSPDQSMVVWQLGRIRPRPCSTPKHHVVLCANHTIVNQFGPECEFYDCAWLDNTWLLFACVDAQDVVDVVDVVNVRAVSLANIDDSFSMALHVGMSTTWLNDLALRARHAKSNHPEWHTSQLLSVLSVLSQPSGI